MKGDENPLKTKIFPDKVKVNLDLQGKKPKQIEKESDYFLF